MILFSAKAKRLTSEIFSFLFVVVLIFYFIFKYQYAFNYQLTFNENYSIVLLGNLVLICYLLFVVIKKRVTYSILSGLIISTLILFYSYEHPNYEIAAIVFSLILCSILCFNLRLNNLHKIFAVYFILFAISTFFCTFNLYRFGVFESLFNNNGVVGIYTAINLPMIFYLGDLCYRQIYQERNSAKFVVIALLGLSALSACAFIIIIESQSRTALLTTTVLILLQVNRMKILAAKSSMFKKTFKYAIIFGLTIAAVLRFNSLYQSKEASASGRLLMLKIASQHIFDNFWFGTGLGGFSQHFPNWQSEYLKIHRIDYDIRTMFNAGESYVILNEYMELFMSVGVFAFAIISLFFIYVLKIFNLKLAKQLYCIKCLIIGILVSSFTSYPFHVNLILLLLCCCITFCLRVYSGSILYHRFFTKKREKSFTVYILCFTMLALSIFICASYIQKVNAVSNWHRLSLSDRTFDEQDLEYKKIFDHLKNDGKFLTFYGTFILENASQTQRSDIQKSLTLLENAKNFFISKNLMESLAYGYWMDKNYRKSIEYFEWLDNYQPYLFEPKLSLMYLHIQLKNFDNAKEIGLLIINMPVKIPSNRINEIKKEAAYLLEKYNLNVRCILR